MAKNGVISCVLVGILAAGCGDRSANEATVNAVAASAELPLPVVPSGLVQPEDRAGYVALHFWDALDFANDTLSCDTAFIEQNFANFVSILPYARRDDARRAAAALLDRAAAHPDAASLMVNVVDKYLGDPNSPMRSDDLYVMFLRQIVECEMADEAAMARAGYRLEQTSKNWPGTRAADIKLLARDGQRTDLWSAVRRDTTLVMFYDPDCEHCKEVTEHLRQSPVVATMHVLAIDVAGNREAWDGSKLSLPERWQVAYALDADDVDEKYYLPALPALYLLSPEGEVLLKDFPSSQIP